MRLLTSADCTIGQYEQLSVIKVVLFFTRIIILAVLILSLHELDRPDAAEVVLRSAPLFKIIEHI